MNLGPVAQRNKELITEKIKKLIDSGTYKNISDVKKRNPSLEEFCFNNKYNLITYSFSSQFTNENYLELLNELEKEMEKKNNQENFQYIDDIDPSKLNNEELQDYNVIKNDAEQKDNTENTQVYFDENGNMTNIVKDNESAITGEANYYTVDNINGEKELVGQESKGENSINSPEKAKVKVKTLSSAAFANTLILSFIIGSFFGIVFLAIYTKIMH